MGVCSMLTGDAHSFGHLVLSHLGIAYALHVETNIFPKLVAVFMTSQFEHPKLLSRFYLPRCYIMSMPFHS